MKKRQRVRQVATVGQRVLTVPQYAQEYGKTERAAWMEIYRGVIPHRRQGRKVIILRDDLETFLRSLPGVTPEEVAEKAAAGERKINIESDDSRCVYCLQLIATDDDAQRVSKRDYAHTTCAEHTLDAYVSTFYSCAECCKTECDCNEERDSLHTLFRFSLASLLKQATF